MSVIDATIYIIGTGLLGVFVGVIVGEFLVAQAGLGYLIIYGGQVFPLRCLQKEKRGKNGMIPYFTESSHCIIHFFCR